MSEFRHSFCMSKAPIVPWRERDGIARIRIAHCDSLVAPGESARRHSRTAGDRLSPSEAERQREQDLYPSI
jgi:hypothetical protein